VCRQDWPQDMMITYLRQNVFSIPPRDNNKIQQLFDVAVSPSSSSPSSAEEGSSEQGVASLPKKYRVPLLFVAKFQWESLRLVLTSANPLSEWDEYKFDIVHLSRLCQHFLRAALKVKQEGGTMDKSWRCPMFDRALTRFYRKWMVSREWSVKKFWHEFAEEEYEIDVLKYGMFLQFLERNSLADDAPVDWIRWALKGHKGFLLTTDEVQQGITAEQFTMGLNKVDGAWTWDNKEWERARELTAPGDATHAASKGHPTATPKRRTKKVQSKKRLTSHMPIDVKIELLEEQSGLGLNGAAGGDLGAVNGDEDGDGRAAGANGSAGDAASLIDLSRSTVDPESPPAMMEGEGAREEEEEEEEAEQDDEGNDEEGDDEDGDDEEDEEMRDGWVTTRQSSPGTAPSARSASTERGVNGNLADAMQDVRASSDGDARSVSVEGGVNGSTSTTPGITPASSFQSTPSIVSTKHPGSTSTAPAPTAIPPSTSLKRVREPTPPSDDNAAEHHAKKARVESVPEIPDGSESGSLEAVSTPTVRSSSAMSSSTPSALTTLVKAMVADGSSSGSTAPSLLNPPTTSVPPPTTTSIQPTTTPVAATPSMSAVALGTFDSNTIYTPTTTTTTTTNQPFRSRATPNRTGTMPYEDSPGMGTAFVSGSGTSVFGVGMGGSASSLGMGGGAGVSSTSLGMGVGSSSSSSSSSLGTGGSSFGNGFPPSSLPRSSSSFLGLGPTMMAANMLGPGVGSSVGMSAGAGIPAAGAGTSLNANGGTLNTLDPATSTTTTSTTSSGSDIQPLAALLHRMLAGMTSHQANDQAQSGNVDGSLTAGMLVNALGATPKVNGSSSTLTAKLAAVPTMPTFSVPVPSMSTQGVSREATPSATTSVSPAPVFSTLSDLSLATHTPTTTSTTNPTMVSTSSVLALTPSTTTTRPPTPIWGDTAQSVIAPPPFTSVKSTPIPIVARSPSPSLSSTASTPPAARTPAPAPPVVNASVVLPMQSTASAASIFTAAAGDSSVTTTGAELYTTTDVDSSFTTTGAKLSTIGNDSSTTLVVGGISSTKPVTPASLVLDVVMPSTTAPIPSTEAPALPASKEPPVSSPATTSFVPVQSQLEEACTGSGWPSNLFSSVISPGASTTPASIASAAFSAAHTYAGSEDMEMSDEDGPKDPVEKPADWSMDEAPSVPTVDEETSLMDQASRLLESVIGPSVERRTAGMWSSSRSIFPK
jgi:hypothetical protein